MIVCKSLNDCSGLRARPGSSVLRQPGSAQPKGTGERWRKQVGEILKNISSSLQVKVEVEAGRNIPANDMVSMFPIRQLLKFTPNDNSLI